MIVDQTQEAIRQHGPDLILVVVWITGDTTPQATVPALGVGLIEPGLVQDRMLESNDAACKIAHLIPAEILEEHDVTGISLENGSLVLARRA